MALGLTVPVPHDEVQVHIACATALLVARLYFLEKKGGNAIKNCFRCDGYFASIDLVRGRGQYTFLHEGFSQLLDRRIPREVR